MLENAKIIIDIDSCTKCKACVRDCVANLYLFESDRLEFRENHEESCIECGHCVAVCPANIINLKSALVEDVIEIADLDNPANFANLLTLVKTRRSTRQFKDEPVAKELIEKILQLARYSPTGSNEENVYYTVVKDPELLAKFSDEITLQVTNFVKKYEDSAGYESLKSTIPKGLLKKVGEYIVNFKRILEAIERGYELWRWNREIIIIHSPKNAMTLVENCSLAASLIMLTAETLGLGTCSLGLATIFLNQFRTVSKMVKIPRKHKVAYTLAIGYPKVKYFRIPPRKPLKVKWL
jgi:nitroreductase/NAD-dependent dihydropyrimidine dehydrogenase PreA subunit